MRADNRLPRTIPRLNRAAAATLGARTFSDVPHRVLTSPRRVVFREMEYAVPREAGAEALRQLRKAVEAPGLRIGFPVQIRVAPADDVPLSPAHRRDCAYIAVHTHRDVDHRACFALVEPILQDHRGRPHWGKLHTRGHADLAASYPLLGDFLALRDRLDPHRVFANAYLRRVLAD